MLARLYCFEECSQSWRQLNRHSLRFSSVMQSMTFEDFQLSLISCPNLVELLSRQNNACSTDLCSIGNILLHWGSDTSPCIFPS